MEISAACRPAIRLENVGRYFGAPLGPSSDPRKSIEAFLRLLGINARLASRNQVRRTAVVPGHVLRNVSLEIEEGSIVWLTGPSGSGKSVLLKIVGGVLPPTTGRIKIYGSVSSLLGIGDNTDSRLTALENITEHCKLRGVDGSEADRYARDVLDFAELEAFAHMPVRTYSTGMKMRLSIALALADRHAILLADDVLGVGDLAFQEKCVQRLLALKEAGRTMLLAFSDEDLMGRLATRVIGLDNGRVVSDEAPGLTRVAVSGGRADIDWHVAPQLAENDSIALTAITIRDRRRDSSDVMLSFDFTCKLAPMRLRPSIILMTANHVLFRSLHPRWCDVVHAPTRLQFTVDLPLELLKEGVHEIVVSVQTRYGATIYSLKVAKAVTVNVRRSDPPLTTTAEKPLCPAALDWEIEPVRESPGAGA